MFMWSFGPLIWQHRQHNHQDLTDKDQSQSQEKKDSQQKSSQAHTPSNFLESAIWQHRPQDHQDLTNKLFGAPRSEWTSEKLPLGSLCLFELWVKTACVKPGNSSIRILIQSLCQPLF